MIRGVPSIKNKLPFSPVMLTKILKFENTALGESDEKCVILQSVLVNQSGHFEGQFFRSY